MIQTADTPSVSLAAAVAVRVYRPQCVFPVARYGNGGLSLLCVIAECASWFPMKHSRLITKFTTYLPEKEQFHRRRHTQHSRLFTIEEASS